jgi:hypothetical protein
MKTLLDDFYMCFLHAAGYVDGNLHIIVAEGLRAADPEDIKIGDQVIEGTYAVEASENSRLVEVRFSRPIAWQVVDEGATTFDESEVRDDNSKLQVFTRSKYFDYFMANHEWFLDSNRGAAKHYCVLTVTEVIDVVAYEPPTVTPYERPKTTG